jgi:hypothetical protein
MARHLRSLGREEVTGGVEVGVEVADQALKLGLRRGRCSTSG